MGEGVGFLGPTHVQHPMAYLPKSHGLRQKINTRNDYELAAATSRIAVLNSSIRRIA